MPKLKKWEYGKSPNLNNWQECADALKSLQKPTRKPNKFMERMDSVEQLLKDHK